MSDALEEEDVGEAGSVQHIYDVFMTFVSYVRYTIYVDICIYTRSLLFHFPS